LGSSKPWEDILEEFAGVRTFSVQSCLKYFQPLREYLEDLVAKGELKVGWQCPQINSSERNFVRNVLFIVLLSNIFLLKHFFYFDT